jgi:hypothetical protein
VELLEQVAQPVEMEMIPHLIPLLLMAAVVAVEITAGRDELTAMLLAVVVLVLLVELAALQELMEMPVEVALVGHHHTAVVAVVVLVQQEQQVPPHKMAMVVTEARPQ